MKKLIRIVFSIILVIGLSGCGNKADGDLRVYKLGVNGTDHVVWNNVNERLKEHGIKLEIVEFSDYVQPNRALSQGEIDLNAFQTVIYFNSFCKENNIDNLSVLDYTLVAPMGIYSNKIKKLEEVSSKAVVAIPNDTTNGGRAIKFLEELGYLELKPESGLTPTVLDITNYLKDIEIVEMVATQIPRSLDDVDFAVINNGVAYEAGLTIAEDAVVYENYQDEGMENYWNIIAVKTEDLNNEDIKKINEIYHTQETKDLIIQHYGGQSIPVWDPQ